MSKEKFERKDLVNDLMKALEASPITSEAENEVLVEDWDKVFSSITFNERDLAVWETLLVLWTRKYSIWSRNYWNRLWYWFKLLNYGRGFDVPKSTVDKNNSL